MTPEQIAKIDGKQQEIRDAMGGGGGGGAQLSPEERQKLDAKRQELTSKAVGEILDATQVKRFRQLELQQMGALIIAMRKDVATELMLTDDQTKQIAAARTQYESDRRAAMQGFQDMSQEDRAKLMPKMQEMQKAAGEKIAGLLTDTQKAKWKDMQGEPFTFPVPTQGGPRPPSA